MLVILETREIVQQFHAMCSSMSNQGYDLTDILTDIITDLSNNVVPDVFSRKYVTRYIDAFSDRDLMILRCALNTLYVGVSIAVSMGTRILPVNMRYGGIDDGDILLEVL